MTKKPQLYYAKSKVKNENVLYSTFDTETDGLGGELLCTTWSTPLEPNGNIQLGTESLIWWFENVFLKLPFPCIHYAHFAQYDWRYLIPYLLQNKGAYTKLEFNLRTDKDIYQITIRHNKKKYIMRDSYAIYPHSLKEFSKRFSPDLEKLTLDFEKTNFDVANHEHLEYAKRDAVALRQSLINYSNSVFQLFGVSLGHTVAGTSVKAWQQTFNDETIINYSKDDEREQFIRNGYYGGIVFLTSNKQHENCKTYDINSSYPYCMQAYPMPSGSPTLTDTYQPDTLGLYHVDIECPNTIRIPILPSRNSKGNMQWVTGRFETTITNFELEFAIKNGYVLHSIIKGMVWRSTINPFYDFVETCKGIRKRNKGGSFEIVAKLNQNALYGKFAAKRERHTIVIGRENLKDQEKAILLEPNLYDDVYVSKDYSEDMPCKPEWSCFITAYARLRLISTAYAIGINHVLYGDTDSLTIDSSADISAIDIGNEYGQFKLEKEWACFRAIAPKTYAGCLVSGKWTGAGKGLSLKKMDQLKYKELYETGATAVEYQSLPSLMVALKKGIKPAAIANRISSKIENSQNYNLQNGEIHLKCANG